MHVCFTIASDMFKSLNYIQAAALTSPEKYQVTLEAISMQLGTFPSKYRLPA